MIIKSATIFCLIALTHSATIRQADIPVEIRYDANKSTGTELNVNGEDTISNDILKSSESDVVIDIKTVPVENPAVIVEESAPLKKLSDDMKIEEVPQKISEKPANEEKEEEMRVELKPAQEQPLKPINDAQKLEEQKIQVLPEEPSQALKTEISEQTMVEKKPEETIALKNEDNNEKPVLQEEKKNESQNVQEDKQPEKANISQPNDMQLRGIPTEIMSGVEKIVKKKEEVVNKIVEKTEEKILKVPNSIKYETVLVQAQEVVAKGLQQLKESVTLKSGPKAVDWETLEKRVDAYFDEQKRKLQTKEEQQPANENFFTNIVNGIQSITTGFFQGNPAGSNPVSNEEAGTGGATGPLNNFIGFINQGENEQYSIHENLFFSNS